MKQRKPSTRKVREGVVVSNKMNKTVTVHVNRKFRHAKLQKPIIRGKKYYAHCDDSTISIGAKVRIAETRPLSKLKRWRVLEIVS